MTDGSFFAALCAENAEIHEAGLRHPTVLAIGAGSLPPATFRHYIEQDYAFLTRYIRVIAQAVAASPDLPTARRLADLLHSTLALEVDGLAALYASFDGDPSTLDAVEPSPTCQAYTDHLLASAAGGDLFVTLSSVLPCQWGYREIGRALHERGLPPDPRFARWIEDYASDAYGELVDWLVARFDELAETAGAWQRSEARRVFKISARYELAFWEMAWTMS
jgi:thiaminase/transcriptional activator TenA